jgi:hypothetical protein
MGKTYYISLRGEQAGPYTRDELQSQGLRRWTPVWNEATWAWTPAESVDELKSLFARSKHDSGLLQRGLLTWSGRVSVSIARALYPHYRKEAI